MSVVAVQDPVAGSYRAARSTADGVVLAARDEHLARWQQRRRVMRRGAGRDWRAGGPGFSADVVQLGDSDVLKVHVDAPDDYNLAGRQESGHVHPVRVVHRSGPGPGAGRRVVDLGARQDPEFFVGKHDRPSGYQDLPGRQQVRRVPVARLREALGEGPNPACRIVQFRNGHGLSFLTKLTKSSCDQHLP
jgi:hypothetical protein